MKTSNPVDLYVKQVKRQLYNFAPEENLIQSLQDELAYHYAEYPDCTFEKLVDRFGTPEEIVKEHLEEHYQELEPEKIYKTGKKLRTSIIVLVLILAISIGLAIKSMQPTPMQPAKEINVMDKTQVR